MDQEFTIKAVISILKVHSKMVISLILSFGFCAYAYATLFITPLYSATATVFIQNSNEEKETIYTTDISAANYLAKTCALIFKDNHMMTQVKESLDLNYSLKYLASLISITNENNTQVLKITVTCANPKEAADIANKIVEYAPEEFKNIIATGNVKPIDEATVPTSPSSPNVKKYTVFGLGIGAFIGILLSVFLEMLDTTVKPNEDLFVMYAIPVFAEIPDFDLCDDKEEIY